MLETVPLIGKNTEITKFLADVAESYQDWMITDSDEDFTIEPLCEKYPSVRIGVRRALLFLERQGRL